MTVKPMKYEDLDYVPDYGSVEIRGHRKSWTVNVSIDQGRAMEADGISVHWIYSSTPAWTADVGLAELWIAIKRIVTWPSRVGK